MSAYYNEIDPFASQWLRELIKNGLIAPGDVDERSIADVSADDIRSYTQCHFFAGIGAWSYALRQAGIDDNQKAWTGSCPCQPFSAAGKQKGVNDERHLWPEFYRLIKECSPTTVFGEQVASKDADVWIDIVQDDLETVGYAVGAIPFPAASIGSPQIRDRLYWVANADGARLSRSVQSINIDDSTRREGETGRNDSCAMAKSVWSGEMRKGRDGLFRFMPSGFESMAYESAARGGRVRGYGNAIVAEQARIFIECAIDAINVVYTSSEK